MNNCIGIELLYEGVQRKLYAIKRKGECQTRQYIDSLPLSDKKKITALLKYTSDNGPPRNKEKFRHLEGKFYELKSGRVRLICFYEQNKVIIITHGFDKPKPKRLKVEIDTSSRIMKEYLEKGGEIP